VASNVAALCTSFKSEILQAYHNLGTTNTRAGTGADTLKGALYYQGTGLGAATTAYNSTGEVSGTGYTAGGITVTNGSPPAISGTTAYWTPSANISWSGLTISSAFDCCFLYNSSQNNRAICVLTFAAQTISAGTFSVTMPANASTSALLQFN
jgi:hypothetical protein